VARSCGRATAGSPGRRQLYARAETSVHALYQAGVCEYGPLAWFRLRYRVDLPLPVPVPVVLQFVVDHVERLEGSARAHDLPPAIDAALVKAGFKDHVGPPKLSTVTHRLSVLPKAHTLKSQPNPVRAPEVQELMRRVRRANAQRGGIQRPPRIDARHLHGWPHRASRSSPTALCLGKRRNAPIGGDVCSGGAIDRR
jgi:hypothetical protein